MSGTATHDDHDSTQVAENLEMQEQELEVLQSIYMNEFKDLGERSFQIALRVVDEQCALCQAGQTGDADDNDNGDDNNDDDQCMYLFLHITFHNAYPSKLPPYFSFETKHWSLSGSDIATLCNFLVRPSDDTTVVNSEQEHLTCYFSPGETCVFQWVEHLRAHIAEMVPAAIKQHSHGGRQNLADSDSEYTDEYADRSTRGRYFRGVIHRGAPYTNRKSKFIGHAAAVHSEEEAQNFMRELLLDNKIARATHNMVAYRIDLGNGSILEHRDDDGETGASENMLFLLKRGDVRNVIVCVTRWYGGILLGPDRFKIITNVAKELLQDAGFLSIKGEKRN